MQTSVMESFQSLRMWIHEYRLRMPSGQIKWVRARGMPRRLHDDSVRWHTIVLDITKEKLANEALSQGLNQAIRTLGRVVEARDPQTGGHHWRVSQLATAIGKQMSLDTHSLEGLRLAAQVHDIGELMVPGELINKPAPLTAVEFEQVQLHAEAGAGLLEDLSIEWPLDKIVAQHHERWDGKGYPNGLSGEDILMEARIIAIAEVVDAMHEQRSYRPSRSRADVLEEISAGRGKAFDPNVADACLTLFAEGKLDDLFATEAVAS
jgi:HD-GYP domain-containing protein (c-di-GMP phosphodiesterase class II)